MILARLTACLFLIFEIFVAAPKAHAAGTTGGPLPQATLLGEFTPCGQRGLPPGCINSSLGVQDIILSMMMFNALNADPTAIANLLGAAGTAAETVQGVWTFSAAPIFSGVAAGTQTSCLGLNSGKVAVSTPGPCGTSGSGISGLTVGQLGIAGSGTTLTSSVPFGTTGNNTVVETNGSGNIANSLISGLPNANLANSCITLGATPVCLGATAFSVSSLVLSSPSITGTVSGGATYSSPTITSPSITGTVSGGATYSSPTLSGTISGTPKANSIWTFLATPSINLNADATPNLPSSLPGLNITGVDATMTHATVTNFANFGGFGGYRGDGTATTPTTLQSNDAIDLFWGAGFDGSAWSAIQAALEIHAGNSWLTSDHSTNIVFKTTPLASTTIARVGTFETDGTLYVGPNTSVTANNTGSGTVNAATEVFAPAMNLSKLFTVASGANQIPACSSGNEGTTYAVKDLTSAQIGVPAGAGGGTQHGAVYCDGGDWTVWAN